MTALPDVFLRYQRELMSSVSVHAVTVVEKSRRTGYSWAAAAIAALTASLSRQAGGQDVYYMGYNLEMAREFIDYVAEWAKHLSPAAVAVEEYIFTDPDNPDKDIKAFRIEFASGFKVVALPSVPRALRGMQGLVIIDEAAFHDALEELLKAAFALLIWGGRVLIISTHDGDTNPFNELVQDIRAGRKPYHLLRCTFDDALADGLYKRICLTKGQEWTAEAEAKWRAEIIAFYGDDANEELFCVPARGTGAWLSGPLIEARMDADIPIARWARPDDFTFLPDHVRQAAAADFLAEQVTPALKKLDRDLMTTFGVDIGRYRDLTVIWVMQLDRTTRRVTRFVVELSNIPFAEQRQILFAIIDHLPRLLGGAIDAGGIGAELGETAAQRYGSSVVPIKFSVEWYRTEMPPLKAAFEDGMITVPKDDDVLSDLRSFKTIEGVARLPTLRTASKSGGMRHGDSGIALALAYFATRMTTESFGYESARPGHADGEGGWDDEDMFDSDIYSSGRRDGMGM